MYAGVVVSVECSEVVEAEIVEEGLSRVDARRLTDEIRVQLDRTWELVVEAYRGGAHRALGYGSWDEYCRAEFGSNRIKLPREERQETVRSLREAGLSIRAISAATGLGYGSVHRGLSAGDPFGSPEPRDQVGTDGKTYTVRPPANVDPDTGEIREDTRMLTVKPAVAPEPKPAPRDPDPLPTGERDAFADL